MKRLAEKDGNINLNFNLNYDDLIDANLAGRTVRFGNDVTVEIFMKHPANNTAHGAVGTFVHESIHVSRTIRGSDIGTQLDELRAFKREELYYNSGKKLTLDKRKDIWFNNILKDYSHKPVGGNYPTFVFE
jgi:hypothetical protein